VEREAVDKKKKKNKNKLPLFTVEWSPLPLVFGIRTVKMENENKIDFGSAPIAIITTRRKYRYV
jgi:hypothetical protein